MPELANYAAFLRALLFAAQRAFVISDSFLRPAAVKPLGRFCVTGCRLCRRLFLAACLRFMASEIFCRASALIFCLLRFGRNIEAVADLLTGRQDRPVSQLTSNFYDFCINLRSVSFESLQS